MSVFTKVGRVLGIVCVAAAYSASPACSPQTVPDVDGESKKANEHVGSVTSPVITTSTELRPDTSATDETNPAAATNNAGRTLVVWQDTRSSGVIMGALVDINGSGNPVLVTGLAGGNPFQIGTYLTTTTPMPSVDSNGSNFFVVWSTRRASTATLADIVGARVSSAGVVNDTTPINISIAAGEQTGPKVVYASSQHVVAWEDAATSQIYGARVSTAGVLTDASPGKVLVTSTSVGPSLATDGTNVLLAAKKTTLWTEMLNSSLTISAGASLAGTAPRDNLSVYATLVGSQYYVAWSDGSIYLRGARFSSAGVALGSVSDIYPTLDSRSALASTGDNGTVLTMWSNPFAANDYRLTHWRITDQAELTTTTIAPASPQMAFTRVGTRVLVVYNVADAAKSLRVRAYTTGGAAVGSVCTADADCGTGVCSEGVCCNEACANDAVAAGMCRTCIVTSGTCTKIVNQADRPTSQCSVAEGTCNADGSCVLPNGKACPVASIACASGNCIDGRCCDTACSGQCDRCNLNGKQGTCSFAALGAAGQSACPNNLLCGGASSACPTSCTSDAMCTSGMYCNAAGNCSPRVALAGACNLAVDCKVAGCRECAGTNKCVDGFCCGSTCASACETCSATPGTCTSVTSKDDADTCTGANTCNAAGTCVVKVGLGKACAETNDCLTGQCVDGVCCDTACAGACDRCNLTGKEGTCSAAPVGTLGAAPACATNILCDGIGATCPSSCTSDAMCPSGTFCNAGGLCQTQVPQGQACNLVSDCKSGNCRECATGYCADGFCCNTACAGSCDTCSATPGTCSNTAKGNVGSPSCTPYRCDGTTSQCPTSCTQISDCADGANCDVGAGKCKGSDPNGTACTKDDTCLSQHCVDGVCCDTACDGQCQACDVTTSKGTCSPVNGAPHGARAACAAATGDDVCSARLCDGSKDTKTCVGYVSIDVGCRNAACKDGVETSTDSCNGAGKCGSGTPVSRPCAPYACGATKCNDTCATDADCAPESVCNTSTHQCGSATTCIDSHTLKNATGALSDCSPYTCSGAACTNPCKSINDCLPGFSCNEQGVCIADSTFTQKDEPPPSDCQCATPGAARSGSHLPWVLAVLFAGARRRRRAA